MRGVFVLLASSVLSIGMLGSASAGCYGPECDYGDHGYRSGPPVTHYPPTSTYYQSGGGYSGPTTYYSTGPNQGPGYHTTYYRRYDNGYHDRPYYSHRPYYRSYSYYDRPYYRPTIRYGGAWEQTGYPRYAYYGDCHRAYIPYGWTWYRARSC